VRASGRGDTGGQGKRSGRMEMPPWLVRVTSSDLTLDELDTNVCTLLVRRLFKIKERKTTIWRECWCGVLHFVSAGFILAVNASLLKQAGFSQTHVAGATSLVAGFSCILSGLVSNLPFILSPSTSTTIYYAVFLQNQSDTISIDEGNVAIFFLGLLFFLSCIRAVATFLHRIIPFVLKVGVCLGVGLLIALQALTEIGIVTTGQHTVLDIGEFNADIYIGIISFILISLALHFKLRGAFLIGLVFGTFMHWLVTVVADEDDQPNPVFITTGDLQWGFGSTTISQAGQKSIVYRLVFDLYIIGIILLNGLAHGLAETAGLKRDNDTLPRGKWLYGACGLGTLLSSVLGAGPVMISPESAPGIKAGARTGLSAVVCGVCFLLSTFISPLFADAPAAATSPVLLMIGLFLFENAKNVNWSVMKESMPVFLMVVFIPYTFSIFNGVMFSFGSYLIWKLFTETGSCSRRVRSCWRRTNRRCRKFFVSVIGHRDEGDAASAAAYQHLDSSEHELSSVGLFKHSARSNVSRGDSDSGSEDGDGGMGARLDSGSNAAFLDGEWRPHYLSFQLNEINDGSIDVDEAIITFQDDGADGVSVDASMLSTVSVLASPDILSNGHVRNGLVVSSIHSNSNWGGSNFWRSPSQSQDRPALAAEGRHDDDDDNNDDDNDRSGASRAGAGGASSSLRGGDTGVAL
jgi:adenine/guanine/hypoxanthine permease